jgi:hypothetical protein
MIVAQLELSLNTLRQRFHLRCWTQAWAQNSRRRPWFGALA